MAEVRTVARVTTSATDLGRVNKQYDSGSDLDGAIYALGGRVRDEVTRRDPSRYTPATAVPPEEG